MRALEQTSDKTEFEQLRKREFSRLDEAGLVYLDYTGAAPYPASLIRADASRLLSSVSGNPHSENGPSLASARAIETARQFTLRFFDADPAVYDVVFTANTTAAIRILAESFPFRRGSRLTLTADNHNSVNGLRLQAQRAGAVVRYIPLDHELRAVDPRASLPRVQAPSLFAFPAQSNFSGIQHPLEWVRHAQLQGYQVLLDAAAFAPTSPLSLADVRADFVAVSFYKMFGYPTGVGALIAKREALGRLRRGYFGGGAVEFVSVQNRMARIKSGVEGFEDGTPNFLSMPAIADGLCWLGGLDMHRVKQHIVALTAKLLERLGALGDRIEIYGPRNTISRGGIVTFNLRRNGRILDYEQVEIAARNFGIAIRGGCFCNPGAAEHAFSIPAASARACLRGKFTIAGFRNCLGNQPVGAVRASFGIPSNVNDLDRLIEFVFKFCRRGQ